MKDPYETAASPPAAPKSTVDLEPSETPPRQIGRYRIERALGKGGFGLVYLAYDNQLQRSVAIKVPHARLVSRAEDAAAYLTEARTVANLDHPNIVPVYDVGSTEQFPCFIVAKYIDGTDLASRLKQSRLSIREAVELVALVADALHDAHKQGLVHRDIKPGNILLDREGKPYVADFGLALKEENLGRGSRYVGTPAYMSPEQASGKGDRVDGRSDIFSLGVVFFELLTGRRPFHADSVEELLDRIATVEVRPPRQIDDRIPRELERICLKALARRASERYTTARDMAEDLRHYLSSARPEASARPEENAPLPAAATNEVEIATQVRSPTTTVDAPPQAAGAVTSRAATRPIIFWCLAAGGAVGLAVISFIVWRMNTPESVAKNPIDSPSVDLKKEKDSPSPGTPLPAALHAELEIFVWKKDDKESKRKLSDAGVLPLQAGDDVQIVAKTNRPAYLYLVQVESSGDIAPMYPWVKYDWDKRKPELPRDSLRFPDDPWSMQRRSRTARRGSRPFVCLPARRS